jgi:hypothetical protein
VSRSVDAARESWNGESRIAMGSTNRKDALANEQDAEREHLVVSDVAGSGVRVDRERETTPAPASTSGEYTSFPSARPTSVPEYDVAAHAFETSLLHQAPPRLPLDLAIPTRTSLAAPPDLELRAAFLLLHVDGRSSVREISELTMIAVDEVLASFLGLTAVGLVLLGGTQAVTAVPSSGPREKEED